MFDHYNNYKLENLTPWSQITVLVFN